MADLNAAPSGNRIRISFFGLRNAGKSTLVNAFTGQSVALVSDVPGTTTDPVSKAMEILPLGPCLVTDTAGLDDVGDLGRMRVETSLRVLETTDVAVWVWGGRPDSDDAAYREVVRTCRRLKIPLLEHRREDSAETLKRRIAALDLGEAAPGLLEGLVTAVDRVVCVCPIDESAPKGRLILPQVQVIRDCLDRGLPATVCRPSELADGLRLALRELNGRLLVVTDSQAFAAVDREIVRNGDARIALTSFSILFARQKGDLAAYLEGLECLGGLKDGDLVLVAEGCTHRRQCNDIGTTKIPKALARLTGKRLSFVFASGGDFPLDGPEGRVALVVQCGGCMLTRREMLRRIARAQAAGVPIVNYGMVLARAAGVDVGRCAK